MVLVYMCAATTTTATDDATYSRARAMGVRRGDGVWHTESGKEKCFSSKAICTGAHKWQQCAQASRQASQPAGG